MPVNQELTTSQAGDVARYYLGPQWRAGVVGHGTCELRDISSFNDRECRYTRRFIGTSWREVFRAAGIKLPSRSRYVQKGTTVMLNGEHIASCISGMKARLVCAALNEFEQSAASLP